MKRRLNIGTILQNSSDAMAEDTRKFLESTSAHGLPRIVYARNYAGRLWWSIAFTLCAFFFITQIYLIVLKFYRFEKMVTVKIQFEKINFPAVTICNMNPYKNSLASQTPALKRLLSVFDSLMSKSSTSKKRKKRQAMGRMEPAYIACECQGDNCTPYEMTKRPEENDTLCLCFYNPQTEGAPPWPCYPEEKWVERQCTKCYMIGSCDHVDDQESVNGTMPCMCIDSLSICIRMYKSEGNSTLKKLWEIEPPVLSESDASYLEALGFGNMTDSVALVTKGKENVMFASNEIPDSILGDISYTPQDMVKKCVFMGRQCGPKDFHVIPDPVFGQCFIFNHDPYATNTVERTGPNHGLRMELFINTSEYLPTTDVRGVRVVVHDPKQQPFPDSVGYLAQTGVLSSFGTHMRKIQRLTHPYGDCRRTGKTRGFIYENSQYSVEGCYRTCLQSYLVDKCTCGDPRFPVFPNSTNCPIGDPVLRNCMSDAIARLGGLTGTVSNCKCDQPCHEVVFEASVSIGSWPATPESISDCPEGLSLIQCEKYHLRESVMMEVFFKELNYQELIESEAYGLPNLLADLGGQLGLWLGVSVLTCVEFMVYVTQISTVLFRKHVWQQSIPTETPLHDHEYEHTDKYDYDSQDLDYKKPHYRPDRRYFGSERRYVVSRNRMQMNEAFDLTAPIVDNQKDQRQKKDIIVLRNGKP